MKLIGKEKKESSGQIVEWSLYLCKMKILLYVFLKKLHVTDNIMN